ncbi:Sodium channel subunit beta-4 [Varanus komodoensis]|nr:Sodium channel subunit beta-4 [Varanus komodoensis]
MGGPPTALLHRKWLGWPPPSAGATRVLLPEAEACSALPSFLGVLPRVWVRGRRRGPPGQDALVTVVYLPQIFKGVVKNKDSKPEPESSYRHGIKYRLPSDLAPSKDNREFNISLELLDAEFSDSGKYTCFVKNPKEKNANHSGTITLNVVVELEKVDNTVTLIILAVVGGVIGLLILIMVIKKATLFILKKTRQKKECLVSSSANDNTENGLAGSKAEQKSAPKA